MKPGNTESKGAKTTRKRRLYLALSTYQGGPILARLSTTKRGAQAWANTWAEKAGTWKEWRAEVRTYTRAERGTFYKEREDLRQAWGASAGTAKENRAAEREAPRGSMRTKGAAEGPKMTEREIMQDLFQGDPEALAFSDQLDEFELFAEQQNEAKKK